MGDQETGQAKVSQFICLFIQFVYAPGSVCVVLLNSEQSLNCPSSHFVQALKNAVRAAYRCENEPPREQLPFRQAVLKGFSRRKIWTVNYLCTCIVWCHIRVAACVSQLLCIGLLSHLHPLTPVCFCSDSQNVTSQLHCLHGSWFHLTTELLNVCILHVFLCGSISLLNYKMCHSCILCMVMSLH